jgi:hypothetical protein
MFIELPLMNGPFDRRGSFEGKDTSKVTDYSIGPYLMYVGFRWSVAVQGHWAERRKAEK